MISQHEDATEPPKAPAIQRKFRLYFFQYIGLPLLLLIPVLAMMGVFSEAKRQIQQNNDKLNVVVDYPERSRYQMITMVSINVQNITEESIDLVRIRLSRSYIERFSNIRFLPSLPEITEDSYEFELHDFAIGETCSVSIELEAEAYGEHTAIISVVAEGSEAIQITIKTFVFP